MIVLPLVSSCTTVSDGAYRSVEATSAKVATVAVKTASTAAASAATAYQRMQRYLAEKEVLKTFHDAGEHGESEVLAVLHKTRTGPSATAPLAASGARTSRPPLPAAGDGTLRWPVDAGVVSSEFGERWGKMHKGIDIAADAGEPVYAVAAGEVLYAGNGLRGYGNVVIVKHDRGVSSLYAHNSELRVKQGDKLVRGQLIALMGSTGHSTGPHVHFEIREGDVAVSPRTLLPKSKLAGVVGEAAAAAAVLLSQNQAVRGPSLLSPPTSDETPARCDACPR
jgi:murein DD-endopeptidase MepM/ murein hydrolase activator NlpD